MDLFGYLDFDISSIVMQFYLFCGMLMFVVTSLHQILINGAHDIEDTLIIPCLIGFVWPVGLALWIVYLHWMEKVEAEQIVPQADPFADAIRRLSEEPRSTEPGYDTPFPSLNAPAADDYLPAPATPRRRKKTKTKTKTVKKAAKSKKKEICLDRFHRDETPPHLK